MAVSIVLYVVVYAALALSTFQAHGADGSAGRGEILRLVVPYPITGPREIQASDRTTRHYRAVAAHAVPPITDVMANLIANAIAVGGYGKVIRERHVDLDQFDANASIDRHRRSKQADLLLAGDDIVRAAGRQQREGTPRRDAQLTTVDPIAVMPFALICSSLQCSGNAAHPGQTIAQLRPRTIGSSGALNTSHLAAQMLRARLNQGTLLVAYTSGTGVLGALVAGQIDLGFIALPLALGYIGQSKVRVLGLASETRFALLPGLPTLVESGLAGLVVEGWFALFASNRLASGAVARLSGLVRAYRLEPATRAELLARGLVPSDANTQEFDLRLAADRERWARPSREM